MKYLKQHHHTCCNVWLLPNSVLGKLSFKLRLNCLLTSDVTCRYQSWPRPKNLTPLANFAIPHTDYLQHSLKWLGYQAHVGVQHCKKWCIFIDLNIYFLNLHLGVCPKKISEDILVSPRISEIQTRRISVNLEILREVFWIFKEIFWDIQGDLFGYPIVYPWISMTSSYTYP